MAAAAPWDSVVDWVADRVDDARDWISNNVSGSPIGLFSTLASIAPYSVPGVRFNIPNTPDRDVLAVLSGSQWNKSNLTYAFPDSRSDYQWINPSASGFRGLTFDTEQAVRQILEGYTPYSGGQAIKMTSVEGFTNLNLQYAGRGGGDLQISGFNPGSTINRSHGYYPGLAIYNGDAWLVQESGAPGKYSYYVTMHELGHVLGLKHPHDSGGNLPTMSAAHDSPEYTVMSYGGFGDRPYTYMQYDIAALQALYGADFTTNGGNTVYRWSSETGESFINGIGQGTPARNYIFATVWDGGGTDTFDLTNYGSNATIDLSPGGAVRFSDAQLAKKSSSVYAHGNIYNAFQFDGDARSLIENAWAGSGNDKIVGNAAANTLKGNGGNDTVTGGLGRDSLYGGDGNDSLDGGRNEDHLDGGDGNDVIDGAQDNDTADGGFGNDSVYGGDGNDVIYGSGGHDLLFGQNGNDVLQGGDGNDYLNGSAGTDQLYGGAGNDFFIGDGVATRLSGGADRDTFWIAPASRQCTIVDFTSDEQIQFLSSLFSSFSAVQAVAYQSGADVVIERGSFSLIIQNYSRSNLAADDFVFV